MAAAFCVLTMASRAGAQCELDKFIADHESGPERLGISLGVWEDLVVAGAVPFDQQELGAAYIFRRQGARWVQEATLLQDDGEGNDDFGIAAAVCGDYAVVSARLDTTNDGVDTGSVYVFQRTGRTWNQVAKRGRRRSGRSSWQLGITNRITSPPFSRIGKATSI